MNPVQGDILVIDGDERARALIGQILAEQGFAVTAVLVLMDQIPLEKGYGRLVAEGYRSRLIGTFGPLLGVWEVPRCTMIALPGSTVM